ncbi:MAG: sel1 repeat family protein, partial [Clostridia bacterium]|nr:sel1 repeat family protein [Clostridia bacterium]
YVMTTEYPMAREAGKPILPAELVETDKSLLAEKYEGIPDCTDAYNDAELSAALLDSIKKIAIKTNDNSPEHNFFIGLAYLGGVDVEVDHEKALELITFAAESGLVEAMKYLVVMYEKGKGVQINYKCALGWQYKIMNILFERFMQQESVEAFSEYYQETLKYIGDLYEFDKCGLNVYGASKVLEDCVSFVQNFEQNRRQYFKDITNSFNELIACLDNDEMIQILIKSRQFLRFFGDKILSRTCQTYRELLDSKRDENSPSQATVRYLLSRCAEYAGNLNESSRYRVEAEEIILKISSESNKDINELRSKCFVDLK